MKEFHPATLSMLGTAIAFAVTSMGAQASDVISSPFADANTVKQAWSIERMRSATPMPLRQAAGLPNAAGADLLGARGPAGRMSGYNPDQVMIHGFPGVDISANEIAPAIGTDSVIWYDYPPPYTSNVPLFGGLGYPMRTLGRLFFDDGTFGYSCSAQSMTSSGSWGEGNRQTVVTAGHCCSDGAGSFFQNWAFAPAYRNGVTPFGVWAASNAAVFTVWHETADLSRDICIMQMHTLEGQSINDAIGGLGYAWNQPLPQHYTATGYPAESPYTGGRLIFAEASDAETDTDQGGDFAYTHGIGNPMTGGSSGGAWLLDYQDVIPVGNYINGVNSYKYISPDRPEEMFGPYIDDLVVDVLFQFMATQPANP